ncbi:hypothetical protein BgiBS90_035873, partial [Biomphalaria glabrata]
MWQSSFTWHASIGFVAILYRCLLGQTLPGRRSAIKIQLNFYSDGQCLSSSQRSTIYRK